MIPSASSFRTALVTLLVIAAASARAQGGSPCSDYEPDFRWLGAGDISPQAANTTNTRVRVDGNLACVVADGATLVLLDISDPSAPVRLSATNFAGLHDFALSGDLLYVTLSYKVQVVDVSVPTNPVIASTITFADDPGPLAPRGNRCYVDLNRSPTAMMTLINATDPYHASAPGIWFLGYMDRIVYEDSLLVGYSSNAGELRIYDASSLSALTQVGAVAAPEAVDEISLVGRRLVVGSGANDGNPSGPPPNLVTTYDLSDPSAPVVGVPLVCTQPVQHIAQAGSTLFTTQLGRPMQMVDLSDFLNPVLSGIVPSTPPRPSGIAVQGNRLYHAEDKTFSVYGNVDGALDVAPAIDPGYDVDGLARAGNLVFMICRSTSGGEVAIYELAAGGTATSRGSLPFADAADLAVVGSTLLVSRSSSGLYTVDFSDLGNLQPVHQLVSIGSAGRLTVDGNLACLRTGDSLYTIDVSDPSALAILGSTTSVCEDMAQVGARLYCVRPTWANEKRLVVLSLSDPANPYEIPTLTVPYVPFWVRTDGSLLVTGNICGISIVDVSDPDGPVVLSSIDADFSHTTGWSGTGACVDGRYLYTSLLTSSVSVFDLSDPASPTPCGLITTYPAPLEGLIRGPYGILGAAAQNGLLVIDAQCVASTGVEAPDLPGTGILSAAPNPFNPRTEIRFSLDAPADVRLAVYDLRGRLVRDLVQGPRTAGDHTEVWDGRDDAGREVSSGVYLARLIADGVRASVHLALVR